MRLTKYLLSVAMVLVGLVLLAAISYLVHGSLEMHPTEEQQGKVRLIMLLTFVCCAEVEAVLWLLIRNMNGREQPNNAIDSDAARSPLRAPYGAPDRGPWASRLRNEDDTSSR